MADPDPLPESSRDGDDVDEDGRKLVPRRVDAVPVQDQTTDLLARAAVVPPVAKPEPAKPSPPSSMVILGQHFDVPALLSTLLQNSASKFLQREGSVEISYETYWKAVEDLDYIAGLVAGQINPETKLSTIAPKILRDYWSVHSNAEDWGDEVRKKVYLLSRIVKMSGLGTKNAPQPMDAIPEERMKEIFRFYRGPAPPGENELTKYGIAQVAAYFKENMIDVGLDIFCVVECPRTIYPYGSGKTTLGLEVAGATSTAIGYQFDLRHDVTYQNDFPRVKRFFVDHRLRLVRVVDEGKNFWYRRSAMLPQQKHDMIALSMIRKDEQAWFVQVDNVFRLDLEIVEAKATHVLRVHDPGWVTKKRGWGEATLYEKSSEDEDLDTWGRPRKSVKWLDLPAGPKKCYHECLHYTNAHQDLIFKKIPQSPLDELLESDPNWNAELLDGWDQTGRESSVSSET